MTVVQRIKFITLIAYKEKKMMSQTCNLEAHLKALEQKEVRIPKKNSLKEIIKKIFEINKIETKQTIQITKETKSWFFEKSQQNRQYCFQAN